MTGPPGVTSAGQVPISRLQVKSRRNCCRSRLRNRPRTISHRSERGSGAPSRPLPSRRTRRTRSRLPGWHRSRQRLGASAFACRASELARRRLQAVASAARLAMTRRTASRLRIYRRSSGITLARRMDVVAAFVVMLTSREGADCVEPIKVPPAKYVPESESGRMS